MNEEDPKPQFVQASKIRLWRLDSNGFPEGGPADVSVVPGSVTIEIEPGPEHIAYESAAAGSARPVHTRVVSTVFTLAGPWLIGYGAHELGSGALDLWSYLPLAGLGTVFAVWGAHTHGVMRGQRWVFARWRTSLNPPPLMPHAKPDRIRDRAREKDGR